MESGVGPMQYIRINRLKRVEIVDERTETGVLIPIPPIQDSEDWVVINGTRVKGLKSAGPI